MIGCVSSSVKKVDTCRIDGHMMTIAFQRQRSGDEGKLTRYADVIEAIKKYDYPGNAADDI